MAEYFVRVCPDGQIDIVEYTGAGPLFEFFRDQIGCSSIEIVKSLSGFNHRMVVDECFVLHDPLPPCNVIASYYYSRLQYMILGTVVIGCDGYRDGEPDVVGFTLSDAMSLVFDARRIRAATANII